MERSTKDEGCHFFGLPNSPIPPPFFGSSPIRIPFLLPFPPFPPSSLFIPPLTPPFSPPGGRREHPGACTSLPGRVDGRAGGRSLSNHPLQAPRPPPGPPARPRPRRALAPGRDEGGRRGRAGRARASPGRRHGGARRGR